MSVRILALVGSLRSGSTNRQLAEAAVKHAPEGVEVVLHEGLDAIPFYNEDIDVEGSVPEAATALRAAVAQADTLLLFSPEYNGTIPAVLKNAIDWLSRPHGSGALSGKSPSSAPRSAGTAACGHRTRPARRPASPAPRSSRMPSCPSPAPWSASPRRTRLTTPRSSRA
jgi:NAD(P)H-dependent FMN reductase